MHVPRSGHTRVLPGLRHAFAPVLLGNPDKLHTRVIPCGTNNTRVCYWRARMLRHACATAGSCT
eukprot:3120557-Rhodomonas_salina.2